jgi:hypothetical protein
MLLLLAFSLATCSTLPADLVFTLRAEVQSGTIELSSAVAVAPNCAVSLAVFPASSPVSLETADGVFEPESVITSPDLGLHLLVFSDDIFSDWQSPCDDAPGSGEGLTIVGQGLSGQLSIEGTAGQRYPDGVILVTAPLLDGMMGAAVFDGDNRFVGLITGVMEIVSRPISGGEEYLVLYPSQIWYMWAQLAYSPVMMETAPFGVTAMSSISFNSDRPSGIQLVSVVEGGRAWNIGLRPGDLITSIDGNLVFHPETLRGLRILSTDTLQATVWSHGAERLVLIPPASDR